MKWRKVTKDEYEEAFDMAAFWIGEECAPTMLVIERYERLGSFAMWAVGLAMGALLGAILT